LISSCVASALQMFDRESTTPQSAALSHLRDRFVLVRCWQSGVHWNCSLQCCQNPSGFVGIGTRTIFTGPRVPSIEQGRRNTAVGVLLLTLDDLVQAQEVLADSGRCPVP
jgi:hypothetical protein